MKRGLLVLFAVLVMAGFAGCLREQACDPCDSCVQPCSRQARCWPPRDPCSGRASRDPCRGRDPNGAMQPQQPPVAAVTYPYYTLRGPRDFLQREPSPIGP